MTPEWVEAGDPNTLADRLSATVLARLETAIDLTGTASMVVAGGSTAKPLYERLSHGDIDWSKVHVTLTDERWVPTDHDESNEKSVRELLMQNRAAALRLTPLYRENLAADEALGEIASDLVLMPRPFSVVLLGMGRDGHTASLFPDAPGVGSALDMSTDDRVVVMRPPSQRETRISLTRPVLLDSAYRVLHITGVDKRAVLERALAGESGEDGGTLPIARFFEQEAGEVTVYWSP